MTCWTKQGGNFAFGDASGVWQCCPGTRHDQAHHHACQGQLFTPQPCSLLTAPPPPHFNPTKTGLPTYTRPNLPVDLNQGFPHNYTPKVEGERSPVDTIIQAATAAHSDLDLSSFEVVTYRNNLNKLLLTPVNTRDGWEMDCCCHGGTLFLDIVQVGAPRLASGSSDRAVGAAGSTPGVTAWEASVVHLCV